MDGIGLGFKKEKEGREYGLIRLSEGEGWMELGWGLKRRRKGGSMV